MKHIRKLLAVILSLALCASMTTPAMAAGESNKLGVVFSATLDTPEIAVSDVDQTVTMTVVSNQAITLDGIGFIVTWDAPLKWTAVTGGPEMGAYDNVATNYDNGKTAWASPDSENVSGVTTIAVITFTVPAGTAAGTYNVGVTDMELTTDFGSNIWEDSASVSAVLTVGAPPVQEPVEEGYTASLSALTTEVSVEDSVSVNIGVSHSDDTVFAAGEVVLSYDSSLLKFNEANSTLGTATVKDNAGTLILEDYGTDKNFGTGVYVLSFDAIADGEANVTITSAAFVDKEDAVKSDLIAATLSNAEVALTINKQTYNVTLPDIFEGAHTVIDGEDYTFSVADGENYDYDTVTATVDGEPVEVIDNGDGTYIVENVTGELVISGTRTEKVYQVTVEGNAAEDIQDAAPTATYNTDYSFTMPSAEGWAYTLESITIDGAAYTGYSVADSVYTIPGAAISGDIVITVTKSQTIASVTVEGTGAGAAAGYETSANIGEAYTLTIVPEAGYNYSVTATMNGEDVAVVDNQDNTYTIEEVTGNIVFYVERTVVIDGVSVTQYLTLDGTVMWLVRNETTLAEGKTATYDGEAMFWSDAYNAYCYLVIAQTLSAEEATAKVGIVEGSAKAVDYTMDVNITGKVDASDAQLVYNMYNAVYGEFDADATMEKFLRADVNADGNVNVEDATAVIAAILA